VEYNVPVRQKEKKERKRKEADKKTYTAIFILGLKDAG